MIIDEISYKLTEDNYIPLICKKSKIIIGHTFNHNMNHFIGWKHRYNGKYKKTAAFTIDAAGSIYKHYEPYYTSHYFNNSELDIKSIVILIENDGWLKKDVENNKLITWVGHIYNESFEVVEKKWRGHSLWSKYSKEQFESSQYLVNMLCNEFQIPLTSFSHNTKIENVKDYEGIMYNSNLNKNNTDLSPAWDFEEFKNKIELI